MRYRFLAYVCAALACDTPPEKPPPVAPRPGRTEVVVLGMIHGGHRTSSAYSTEVVKEMLRAIRPAVVCCEIPPGRLAPALEEYRRTGRVTEPRVRIFPEYTDALFPLTEEMAFEIVPCAAWTAEMARERKERLERYRTERKRDHDAFLAARRRMNRRLEREGIAGDPERMHAGDRYDVIVAEGMEPYDRLFNDDLGPGGWSNINEAHFALIAKALDRLRGGDKRVAVMFGAWHKHRILRELGKRGDVVVRPLADFWP